MNLWEIEFTYEFAAEALRDGLEALEKLQTADPTQIWRLRRRLMHLEDVIGDAITRCEELMIEADERTTA